MSGDDSTPEEPFDPYRFGRPEHPIPPEYAPPGYVPDPSPQPMPPHPYYGQSPYAAMPPPQQPGAPYPYPPYQQPGYPPQRYPVHYPAQQGSSGLAIASMVLGILSVLGAILFFFDAVFVILALVFGIVALRGHKPGRGMAIAGVTCASVGAVLAILTTVALNSAVQDCGGWSHLGDPGFTSCIDNH